ncbi:MAG: phospholipid/cholesterol/gamma-HCH transport system substrate-binding protein [Thermoleophilaceae bacterium]|jgi:virulence factor Mce-like protein|nr:phospholipid/cholesterol/gamma-HCH transport system substrate-binding protein [Thermoleophilaceae bacterium]
MDRRKKGFTMTPFAAGLTVAIIVAVISFLVFGNDVPFTRPYQVKAVVANANNIKPKSPVRIAGVEVGRVQTIEPAGDGSTASVVTMNLDDKARPIFTDAQLKIRPRIFLEGNFFVDLQPGTPGAKEIPDQGTIPLANTASPVQLDEVLTALQSDTRKDLQKLIQGYGGALNGKSTAAEDKSQDPSVRGATAAAALNGSIRYAPKALRGTALVNEALLGTQNHDLSRGIAGLQKVSAALVNNEGALKDLVTNFNTTMAAFASEQGNLRQTIALVPQVLDLLNPTLDNLNASFPPTRAFAREVLPGVRETPATIDAAFPWIHQARGLLSPAELQGLVGDLRPTVASLSSVTDDALVLLPQVDLVSRCMTGIILPTGDVPIDDPPLSTGIANYKEFFQTLVGLSGEAQNFDGNGPMVRFQTGGGANTLSTGSTTLGGPPLFANPAVTPLGTRPARPAKKPPYNRTKACYTNDRPNLNARTAGGF